MADNLLQLKDDNFDKEIVKAKGVALVDFWASWCMPCKMMAPVVEELAKDYAGKVKVAKVEVDEAGEVASRFNVMNIPTLIIFKDGKEAGRVVGVTSKEEIAKNWTRYLNELRSLLLGLGHEPAGHDRCRKEEAARRETRARRLR